jgi:hypothetical protein
VAKSTIFSRAEVTPKLSWPTVNFPFCTPGMIVAKVPFCTLQVMPSTFATALRRSTSAPTFFARGALADVRELGQARLVGRAEAQPVRGARVGGLSSAACRLASSATAETTSAVG